MNLDALFALRERLENAAIAGVQLVGEDFRLKRAVEEIEPYTKAAAVFAQIHKLCLELLEGSAADPSAALLDALALIDAVLTTQGKIFEGESKEIAWREAKEDLYQQIAYSRIKPVLEALSTSGSGRHAVISEALENEPEIFRDYRMKARMVAALGDSYSEIGDLAKNWLCQGGEELLPLLKEGFDPKGKKEMTRRMEIIDHLFGGKENEFYREMIADANKEVREAAIFALRHEKSNEELLFSLAKTEKGKCKEAALKALSYMDSQNAREYIRGALLKKSEEVAPLLYASKEEWVSDILAEALEKEYAEYLKSRKEGKEAQEKMKGKMETLLFSAVGKYSEKMIEALENAYADFPQSVERAAYLSLISDPRDGICAFAERMYGKHQGAVQKLGFAKYLMRESAETTYRSFAPCLKTGLLEKLKGKRKEGKEIIAVMSTISYDEKKERYQIEDGRAEGGFSVLPFGLDPRWYESLMKYEKSREGEEKRNALYYYGNPYDMMLARIYNPHIKGMDALYGEYFYRRIFEREVSAHDIRLLKRYGWTRYKGIVSGLARENVRLGSMAYSLLYLLREIPLSGEELAGELEVLMKKGKGISPNTLKLWGKWADDLRSGIDPRDLS